MIKPIANQNIIQKVPLVVTSADDLDCMNGHIHDEYLELDDVSFSKDKAVVTIPYRRIFHGHPGRLIRNWLILKTYEVDVIRSILTISNVQEFEIDDKSHVGAYSFNTMSNDNGILLIKCNEDCDLRMVVNKLEVESRDLEVKGKARITHGVFGFGDMYTSRVY